ncbi:hypothetical protein MTR67_022419 [Solanum verrucosum]|uniref:Uncharacterized protein n=1 Tax=Solanum verrucosum TaxID=315347 RepID=A0AAF0TRA1_SOLVR|nr:hypothetical protein MTR67_022419 [Solanum verrucosum]
MWKKPKKMADEETLDEINKLPESLLVQIISLLPIKDAFKTSCVKKVATSLDFLEINNPNLKILKLKDIWPEYEEGDHTLEIVAPYIQHLEISSDIDDFKCRLVNVSSLVTAEITFDIRFSLVFLHQVLFMLQLDGVHIPELKCKCLTLKFHISEYNLYGVATLLQASPHVETLNIDMESYVIFDILALFHISVHLLTF